MPIKLLFYIGAFILQLVYFIVLPVTGAIRGSLDVTHTFLTGAVRSDIPKPNT